MPDMRAQSLNAAAAMSDRQPKPRLLDCRGQLCGFSNPEAHESRVPLSGEPAQSVLSPDADSVRELREFFELLDRWYREARDAEVM